MEIAPDWKQYGNLAGLQYDSRLLNGDQPCHVSTRFFIVRGRLIAFGVRGHLADV